MLAPVFLNPHKYEKLHKKCIKQNGHKGQENLLFFKNVMLKMTVDISSFKIFAEINGFY